MALSDSNQTGTGDDGNAEAGGFIRLFAPAKINLYLHVLGQRDDGYHLLDSLMAFAGIGDVIAVRAREGITLSIDGPFASRIDAGGDNLVLKAARALRSATGIKSGAEIILTKNLPVASGIGGGSADGAAALRALARLWGISLDKSAMAALALGLGADVPFCLEGRAAFVGGIGEEITTAPTLPDAWVVLVNPLTPLSTPAVFKARTGEFSPSGRFDAIAGNGGELAALLTERRNDLTQAAISLMPEIGEILAAFEVLPNCLLGRMSGSGATCFGLFADEPSARDAEKTLMAGKKWWVKAAALIGDARDLDEEGKV
ncbi:MAG: 4-(cytidine 5'-diphospho)-2-C-methyl-D-erythritol kinase [Rhodospirillaceae bacterium]|nr:4-(cytidine 5'-diphospho)-2-C-methyl-D-erythritol kinase [Rhodospirillaceae bacterium]MBT5659856.1 4-(cytidine 5'-diphospho)-2-C-methyl-D-erythritol kinase [Rhodospirillaceae bacterium]MBT5751744.1 4-(cytidine 5'-diphospho)-2-C-methyl-D-erythritol kinase [Rhodospirillaceae bacterium]